MALAQRSPDADSNLGIKIDQTGRVSVVGATCAAADSEDALIVLLRRAIERRSTAPTLLNADSSRSHLFMTILLKVTQPASGVITTSKLTLVDLAGSERVVNSGSLHDRDRLAEATAINKSLSALGDVIGSLTSGSAHIPYRNSKLTMLMADSIGGNAKTLLLVALNPSLGNASETKSSLEYAQRAKLVENSMSRNIETRETSRLRAQVEKLTAELEAVKSSGSSSEPADARSIPPRTQAGNHRPRSSGLGATPKRRASTASRRQEA